MSLVVCLVYFHLFPFFYSLFPLDFPFALQRFCANQFTLSLNILPLWILTMLLVAPLSPPPSHHIPPFICSIYECNTHLLCQNASSVSSNKTRNIRTAALHIWHIHRCFRFVEFEICIEQHFIWMEIFIIFHRKYIIICILPFSSGPRSFRIRAAAACYCYCHLLAWCFLRIRCNWWGENIMWYSIESQCS